MDEYERQASEWLRWVTRATGLMNARQIPSNVSELHSLIEELERFKAEDLPPKYQEKQRLTERYSELYSLFEGTELLQISSDLSPPALSVAWQRLEKAMEERTLVLEERAGTVQVAGF